MKDEMRDHLNRVEKILFYVSDMLHNAHVWKDLGEERLEELMIRCRLATRFYSGTNCYEDSRAALDLIEAEYLHMAHPPHLVEGFIKNIDRLGENDSWFVDAQGLKGDQ